jgi:hypothetical protein
VPWHGLRFDVSLGGGSDGNFRIEKGFYSLESGRGEWRAPLGVCTGMGARTRVEPQTERVVAALRAVTLLGSLTTPELRRLAEQTRCRRCAEGEVVVEQGERGFGFYILLEGCASVSVDGAIVGTLHAGDTFGEIAAVGEPTRTATIVAATDMVCLTMTPWHLRGFLSVHAPVAWSMLLRVARLLATEGATHA